MTLRRGERGGRATVAVIAVIAAMTAGCAGKAPVRDRPQVVFAEGFHLEMWTLGPDRYATLYRVNGARRLGFGGGVDALNRRISWVGTLTDEQYAELQGLLERHGWFAGTVSTRGEPAERVTRVQLRWPGGSRRFKLEGDGADVQPVRDLLDGVAKQRLSRDLDRLPEAGEVRYK